MNWNKLILREVFRSTISDLQNTATVIICIALLLFPYQVLPDYYSDLGNSLSQFKVPTNGLAYFIFLPFLGFVFSLQKRRFFASFSPAMSLENTLPISNLERIVNLFFLGFIIHLPVFALNAVGALCVIIDNRNISLLSHVFALSYGVLISLFMTCFICLLSGAKSTTAQVGRLPISHFPFLFRLNHMISRAPLRVLLFLIVAFFAFEILKTKAEFKMFENIIPIISFLSGVLCLLLVWVMKPSISEIKNEVSFFNSLPSRWFHGLFPFYFIGGFILFSWTIIVLLALGDNPASLFTIVSLLLWVIIQPVILLLFNNYFSKWQFIFGVSISLISIQLFNFIGNIKI